MYYIPTSGRQPGYYFSLHQNRYIPVASRSQAFPQRASSSRVDRLRKMYLKSDTVAGKVKLEGSYKIALEERVRHYISSPWYRRCQTPDQTGQSTPSQEIRSNNNTVRCWSSKSIPTCRPVLLEKRPASVPPMILSQGGMILEEQVISMGNTSIQTTRNSTDGLKANMDIFLPDPNTDHISMVDEENQSNLRIFVSPKKLTSKTDQTSRSGTARAGSGAKVKPRRPQTAKW